ncbi:unnamed protein product [Microthlaspi erraticum]|uniref:CCHC-type domain-containing protein n=1 Tax=Microthlaspi erraticum TaxID=1685480 RepID=A0A6D2IPS0_9BRAS|nr:unnamed protein product [Microthlaspi erraticum]
MESTKDLIAVQKQLVLEEGNFGHWKVCMRHLIRGINEDAWTAVEDGWSEPTITDEEGVTTPKPKSQWTHAEKAASKFNSKALSTIFSHVEMDQFKIIQGCYMAKDAWDTLANHFEGDTSVKRTRLDHLASQFENLRMEKDESVASFTAKLNTIANEASVLGKKYKEKKLVKKLLRCLPSKFSAHKAVLKYTMNTDKIKFDYLVGMLKAEEMEAGQDEQAQQKGIAFTAEKEEERIKKVEDNMSLMAINFNKMLKRVEKGQADRASHSGGDKSARRKDHQCHECEGYGHFRDECPLAKRKEFKCVECKGSGHKKKECPNTTKRKENSFLVFSDSECQDEEEDSDGLMLNFMALMAEDGKPEAQPHSDSESDDDFDAKKEYRKLYDHWVKLSNDNLQLIKDKAILKAQINILELELKTSSAKEEKQDALDLKTDQILSSGQPPKKNWGLGYHGVSAKEEASYGNMSNFVRSITSSSEQNRQKVCHTLHQMYNTYQRVSPAIQSRYEFPMAQTRNTYRRKECYFCGEIGHIKRNCFALKKRVRRAWSLNHCFIEPKRYGWAWIKKDILYDQDEVYSAKEETCNLAQVNLVVSKSEQCNKETDQASAVLREKQVCSVQRVTHQDDCVTHQQSDDVDDSEKSGSWSLQSKLSSMKIMVAPIQTFRCEKAIRNMHH